MTLLCLTEESLIRIYFQKSKKYKVTGKQMILKKIDMCGYYPNNIDTMLDVLKGKVGRYVFVSTTSHLQIDEENTIEPINEDLPLVPCSKAQRDDPL